LILALAKNKHTFLKTKTRETPNEDTNDIRTNTTTSTQHNNQQAQEDSGQLGKPPHWRMCTCTFTLSMMNDVYVGFG
jgi:hypothetical protein